MERIRGTADIPISPEGGRDIRAWGKWFKDRGGLKLIYHSDLLRDVQTAEILGKSSRATLINLHSSLQPQNMGRLQGMPKERFSELQARLQDLPDSRPPGGESLNEFKRTYLPTFWDILRISKTSPVGLVTHGSNVKLVNGWLTAGAPRDLRLNANALNIQVPTDGVFFINPVDCLGNPPHVFGLTDSIILGNGLYCIRHGRTEWSADC